MYQLYNTLSSCQEEGVLYTRCSCRVSAHVTLLVAQSGARLKPSPWIEIAAAVAFERDRTRVVRDLSDESSLVVDHRFPGFSPPPHHRSAMLHPSKERTSHTARKGWLHAQ